MSQYVAAGAYNSVKENKVYLSTVSAPGGTFNKNGSYTVILYDVVYDSMKYIHNVKFKDGIARA